MTPSVSPDAELELTDGAVYYAREANAELGFAFIAEFADAHERNEAIALAYLSGRHTMVAIAAHFGVHYTTVSRLVKAYEADQKV